MNRVPPTEEVKRLELYRQGLSDQQIADRLGYHRVTIRDWRLSRGLPAWGGRGRRKGGHNRDSA